MRAACLTARPASDRPGRVAPRHAKSLPREAFSIWLRGPDFPPVSESISGLKVSHVVSASYAATSNSRPIAMHQHASCDCEIPCSRASITARKYVRLGTLRDHC